MQGGLFWETYAGEENLSRFESNIRFYAGEEIPFPLNQIFDWSRQVLLVLFQCSTCPALSKNLLHTLNLGQYAMIYNEVRQIIVAWLPFLFLSNLSKTFSKPFLLALSSPSLFICMKAILLFVVTTGTRLVCRLCCLLCTCVTTTSTSSICGLTSTDASCRYWNRRIGNQKAASGQGIRKAYTNAYTN